MTCIWNRCKRCGAVSTDTYCKKCKKKISARKRYRRKNE